LLAVPLEPVEARALFPLTDHWIYMNHAGLGPMSERGRAAVESALEAMTGGPFPGDYARQAAEEVRERLAALFNCPADCLTLPRTASHGISLLASGLDWQPGDNVVGARGEYPANVYPWMNLRRRGVEYRLASNKGGRVSVEEVLSLVDEHTRVVALSHVEFWNGFRVDIDAIGRECRERGVIMAVDATQSAGALRIDLSRLPIDFLAAGAYKWLLAPQGIGVAYFTPELLRRIQPPIVGTGSVRNREEYFRYDLTLEPSARRFEEASLSPLDLAAFRASLDIFLEVGMAVVEKRVLALGQRLAEGLDSHGYEVIAPWPRADSERSGIVSFKKPGAPPAEILRDLNAAHIVGRQHADFVRLSPHFYNTDEEVDRVLEVLAPQAVG
jgi:cysteine desulfurase/selenocysteine lyase